MTGAAERETFGIFYGWWRGDPLPTLAMPDGVVASRLGNEQQAPVVETLDPAEAAILRQQGHRLYVALIGSEIVAYGWAATTTASIGELGVEMRIASNERYLWGFVTLPNWRGQGIYPALIQAMLRQEADADRFWIGHDVGNDASASGILKAGFVPVGEAYRNGDGSLRYARSGDDERSRAAQALLEMPE
ncbi:MAG TPA: GNAT family N-acetyltransferase [Thermomicrobiales bacterium]|nr:GNAT family N-acetyltransferase [Thermomicrobiales bacterium]